MCALRRRGEIQMKELTEIERRYASLRWQEGLTVAEVARRVGRSATVVKRGLLRAQAKMARAAADPGHPVWEFAKPSFTQFCSFDDEICW